jgi:cytosine/adenosine deaminase-related metal-dependent hydrolase
MSGLTFINAALSCSDARTVRVAGGQICALGEPPRSDDRVLDLRGDRLLPGLINAHDHLQLNNLPPLPDRDHYLHVRSWIADVDARRRTDPAFEASVAMSREERLLIGGIKNLLSGVTTVGHHDPLYPYLLSPQYPVRVVGAFGWSHSLYLDGEDSVRASCLATGIDRPWIIHAAEGVDREAEDEFDRLRVLGCVRANTLIVHGIALTAAQRSQLERAGGGLIWCPASNRRLFGRTAAVRELVAARRVALGTDSRLSGSLDLLEELHVAAAMAVLDAQTLESLVTRDSARLLRLSDRGELKVGALADLLVLPAGSSIAELTRSQVRLVMLDGRAVYGDRTYARAATPSTTWADIRVDGAPKVLDRRFAVPLAEAQVREAGVEVPRQSWRAA